MISAAPQEAARSQAAAVLERRPPTVRPLSVNVQALRDRFPPRPAEAAWAATLQPRGDVVDRLTCPPFSLDTPWNGHRSLQVRGLAVVLDWLQAFPGRSWQERWLASGADDAGSGWQALLTRWLAGQQAGHRAGGRHNVLAPAMALLLGGDVLRPGLPWFLSQRTGRSLMPVFERARDPGGFARLRRLCATDAGISHSSGRMAIGRIAVLVAAKGGLVTDVTVGDCIELADTQAKIQKITGAGMSCFYRLLHMLDIFPADAPPSLRVFRAQGQLSPDELIARYGLACQPVRQVLADYLRERQPALDYSSLQGLASMLAGSFWRDIETHHPGIGSLRLPAEVADAWKHRLRWKTVTVTTAGGQRRETTVPRTNVGSCLAAVRAFYLDLAQWAAEDPARWGPWAVPCPVRAAELPGRKEQRRLKSRMDARTRERLPVLPALARSVKNAMRDAAARLSAAAAARPGQEFTAAGQALRRSVMIRSLSGRVFADDPAAGRRRDLTREEHDAFWTWAAVEVLRHTGIRIEELTELTHHSFVQYRLPSTGELVPLLQIAPSKTDAERLLLISPELADVLAAIVARVRRPGGAIPLVAAYDKHERIWNPPLPLLFQARYGTENRLITGSNIRQLLARAITTAGLTDAQGQPLRFTPHDFRRIFITDVIMNGLPPHIAQIICGHRDINVTMGYKAVYPHEAVQAHLAFLARRRSTRPSEEYRVPTDEEWNEFLGHFEKRKVSIGTCARAFGTPCIHEHACVRCSMLWPDPAQRDRLTQIRDNLRDRIAEAEREGWHGEAEGLQISLAGAQNKLGQLDERAGRSTTNLGMPDLSRFVGNISTATPNR